ncbi:autotransporter outer membrane beta-barrel domain-containing protein [Fusobacterium varium]|uniref:autotransporter family protein n=1 Tax=Fusobacterium varium TaxID=856 RepID=UPI002FF18EEE
MIEKIMKAVKSSNKKRSRNITIGTIVGFLLSYTAVMGTDNYLWIKGDSGEIKFNTEKTNDDDGSGVTWSEENPYENAGNIWDTVTKTYTNNTTLLSSDVNGKDEDNNDISYGLRLSGSLTGVNFVNNGSITGIMAGSASNRGYGIHNSAEMGNIENTGVISGSGYGGNAGNGYGIFNASSKKIGNIENTGVINGSNNGRNNGSGFGIVNDNSAEMGNITNTGVISGFGAGGGSTYAFGIHNNNSNSSDDGKIGNITNTGIISGSGAGIYNNNSDSSGDGKTGNITNTGVIYGKTNAIKNNNGTIGTVDNYGILATQGSSIIDGSTGTEKNYGLYIGENGKITVGDEKLGDKSIEVVVGYDKDGKEIKKSMTIRNATLNGDSGSATSTVSFEFKGEAGKYDNSILNGKDETLKVSGTGNQITGSIINAYETAVVMENDSTLILNNTVVNGGAAEDGDVPTIEIVGKSNTLTLKGESIVNIGAENSVAITVGGENNVLVLEGNAKVNGEMKSTGNNTLSLNGNAEDGMNMLHNISGFTNMNIDKNVTFFEEVKVTGTKKITIAETGTLNLRLKNTGSEETVDGKPIPKATHAFSGNTGMVIQGEGNGVDIAGTLRFITNGIGKKIYVDMKEIELRNLYFETSSIIDDINGYDVKDKEYIILGAYENLNKIYKPENTRKSSHRYESLNNIYKGIYSSTDDNLNALRVLISSNEKLGNNYDENLNDEEQLKNLLSYLGSIYTGTPYSFSSELSRKSMGMFRDIVTENQFKPNLNQWLIMGGLTHRDGGTKDSYYGQNYHGFDTGTADVDVDMKLTGAYALGKYGYSENVSLGVTAGGNKSEAKLPMSKVKGNSGYVGAFAENYRGNLTLKAGAGIQYSEYDSDRATLGGHSYSDKYSDMAYDIYLNGRYSHNIGENLFLEPYGTLSYTYIKQDSADEGSKVLAIETDSKSFDYTAAKVGVDLKKVISHEKGKSTVSAGVSYTRLLTGADEENITGRFKGKDATDFDILVAHKNEQSIGLNAKYALELENGILFDVKGSYSLEKDSHNGTGKNRNKGEWIVGAGIGYKF